MEECANGVEGTPKYSRCSFDCSLEEIMMFLVFRRNTWFSAVKGKDKDAENDAMNATQKLDRMGVREWITMGS